MGERRRLNPIKQAPLNEAFTTFCVVRKQEVRHRNNGKPYLVLELGDRSGRLKAKLWDHIESYLAITQAGAIVKIQAMVQEFRGSKELKITRIRAAKAEDQIDTLELLPRSPHDPAQLEKQLQEHIDSLDNPQLRKVIEELLSEPRFRKAYLQTPAGKLWHHNYLGGLLEHVVTMLEMSDPLMKFYPRIDRDLLKAGIILHDLGKVKEYSLNGYIDFSDQGRLHGHVAMGYHELAATLEDMEEFPEDLRERLLHLMISHPGEAEFGAAVKPMTLEAIALQYLIALSANTNALCRIIEYDALPNSRWTKYIHLLDRFIYVGPTPAGENSGLTENPDD